MRPLVRVLGLLALAASVAVVATRTFERPYGAAGDLLPMWLGAKAWLAGRSPSDPAVLEALYREAGLRLRVGGFASYYPPTAAPFGVPLALLSFPTAVTAWRVASIVLLVAAAWLASGRRWAGAWIAAALLPMKVVHIVLVSGQPSPLSIAFTGLGLAGLGADLAVATALGLSLGVATKLLPVSLVPALAAGRRGTPLLWAGGLLLVLLAVAWGHAPSWSPVAWVRDLRMFLDPIAIRPWLQNEPRWVIDLWHARVAAIPAWLVLAGVVAWRRVDPTALGALGVATVGLQMAGSHHYHEALALFPALAWALGRSWPLAAWTLLSLSLGQAWGGRLPQSSLHWIPMGWAIWVGIAVETAVGARARPG